jgi:hypothetical protein
MTEMCVTHEKKGTNKISLAKLMKRDHLGDKAVNENKILKWAICEPIV